MPMKANAAVAWESGAPPLIEEVDLDGPRSREVLVEIRSTRPFQRVTGPKRQGTAFGGARGRTDVARIVDRHVDGRVNVDELMTHTLPLEEINRGFDRMQRAESILAVVLY